MIKSCSLTDLLNNIDYSALSQLLLDAPPAEPEPQQQQQRPLVYTTPACHHPLNYMVNEPQVDALCPDYGASYKNNGLKRKRIMTVVDGASSFDDGSRLKEKLQLPSDSRSGGTFFGNTSGYCNQLQLPEAGSSSFQCNSHPFLNQQLMQ
jgi:hypothetical protein